MSERSSPPNDAVIPCVTVNVIAAGLLNHPAVVGVERGTDSAGTRVSHPTRTPVDRRRADDRAVAKITAQSRACRAANNALRSPAHPRRDTRSHSADGATGGRSCTSRSAPCSTSSPAICSRRLVQAMNMLGTTDDVDAVITIGPNIHTDDLPPPAPGVRIEKFRSTASTARPMPRRRVPRRLRHTRGRPVARHPGRRTPDRVPTSPTTPTDARHSAPA